MPTLLPAPSSGPRTSRRAAFTALIVLLACSAGAAVGADKKAPDGFRAQLAFGTQMAQRGLWNEAVFRFEQASRLEPGNAHALSNLAVAYEALGRFEDALATYQKAIKLDPANADVKRNYSRFADFYQGFKPKPVQTPAGAAKPGAAKPEKPLEKPPEKPVVPPPAPASPPAQ